MDTYAREEKEKKEKKGASSARSRDNSWHACNATKSTDPLLLLVGNDFGVAPNSTRTYTDSSKATIYVQIIPKTTCMIPSRIMH
jgi:hypothetical protein